MSEAELEAIARGGGDDVDLADGAGGATTRRLLGDYATPARYLVFETGAGLPLQKQAQRIMHAAVGSFLSFANQRGLD